MSHGKDASDRSDQHHGLARDRTIQPLKDKLRVDRESLAYDLSEREEKFHLFYEQSPLGYQSLDREGRFLDVNPAWLEMMGYERKEVIGRWFGDFLSPDSKEVFKQKFPKFIAAGLIHSVQFEIVQKDDNRIAVEIDGRIGYDKDGNFVRTHCVVQDITERKKAELRVEESELRLRNIFENTMVGFYRTTPDGRILMANKAMLKMMGYSSFEQLAKRNLEQEEFEADYPRSVFKDLIEKEGRVVGLESAWKRQDGTTLFVRESAVAIRDDAGRTLYYDGSAEDITERKLAEQLQRESESKYQAMFENMKAGSCVDEVIYENGRAIDYRILDVNPAFERITGISREKAVGALASELYGTGKAPYLDVYSKVAETGEPADFVAYFEPIQKYLHVTTGCFKPGYFSNVFIDITEQQRLRDISRESDARYAGLFSSMSDGVAIYKAVGDGEDFIFDDINSAGESIGQITFVDIAGRSVLEVFPGIKKCGLFSVFQEVWKTGEPKHHPVALYNDNRVSHWVENYVFKLPSGEIVVVYKDVTTHKQAEDALRERQEKLDMFFNQSLDGFFFMMCDEPVRWNETVDKDKTLDYVFSHQRVTEANDAMLDQYGIPREQFIGRTPADFFAHDPAAGRKVWREFFDAGRLRIETDERRADGARIWIEGDYICMYDEQGRIIGHFGVQRDVTDRKTAMQDIAESEKRFRTLYESVQAGVIVQWVDGTIAHANKMACDIFGMNESSIQASTSECPRRQMVLEDGTPVDGQDHLSMITIRTGKPIRGAIRGLFFDDPKKMRWLLINTEPVIDSSTGNLKEVIITFQDITELKQTEQILIESQQRHAMALDAADLGAWDWDLITGYIVWSGHHERLFGYSPGEFDGTYETFSRRVHPDDIDCINRDIEQALRDHCEYRCEYRVLWPDGTVRWLTGVGRGQYDQAGKPLRMLGIVADITDHMESKQALLSYQSRLRLLATKLSFVEEEERRNVALWLHDEIAQRLTVTKLSLQSLTKQSISGGMESKVDDLLKGVDSIIDEIRSETFELGSPGLYMGGLAVGIESWLDRIVEKKHGIKTSFNCIGDFSKLDKKLTVMMFRSTRELLANIIKHAKAKNVAVGLDQVEGAVRIIVKDDGVGFDPDGVLSGGDIGPESFGLMSVCEQLEHFGGKVNIESDKGKGTCVTIKIPIQSIVVP